MMILDLTAADRRAIARQRRLEERLDFLALKMGYLVSAALIVFYAVLVQFV